MPMSPDGEGEDAESPMPHPSQFGGKEKRRGAVSAEPITEEDITAYVKKVVNVIYVYKWPFIASIDFSSVP